MCEQLKVGERFDVYRPLPTFEHSLLKDTNQCAIGLYLEEFDLIRFDFMKLKSSEGEFYDTVYAECHEVRKIGTFIVKEVFTNRDPGTII